MKFSKHSDTSKRSGLCNDGLIIYNRAGLAKKGHDHSIDQAARRDWFRPRRILCQGNHSHLSRQADFGIAVCGTGIGISIAANKVPGVRAALAHDLDTARLAREHNDANVLALGGRVVTGETAIEMVQVFLTTAYLGGRHQRRLDKIAAIEKEEGAEAAKR